MRRQLKAFFVVFSVATSLSACAASQGSVGAIGPMPPLMRSAATGPIKARPMPTAGQTTSPSGFVSFCIRFSDQCKFSQDAAKQISLTDAMFQTLARINTSTNDDIWPEEDAKHYGRAEYWTIPTDGYGDCEDIALTKRKKLVDAGLPMPALRIAVVVTPRLERHAVLTVVTDKGDLVLDNLTDEIKSWDETGYRWLERQDPLRPMGWVTIGEPVQMLASAAQIPAR